MEASLTRSLIAQRRSLEEVIEAGRLLDLLVPLAGAHGGQDGDPLFGGGREGVKHDAIDEGDGCARDALGGTVLPNVTRLHLGVVHVRRAVVDAEQAVVIEAELSGDGLGPPRDELVLRVVRLREDVALLGHAERLVLVHETLVALVAQIEQVRQHLSNLP